MFKLVVNRSSRPASPVRPASFFVVGDELAIKGQASFVAPVWHESKKATSELTNDELVRMLLAS